MKILTFALNFSFIECLNLMVFLRFNFSLTFIFSLKGDLLRNLEIVTTLKSPANPIEKFAKSNNLQVYSWPYTRLLNNYEVGVVVSFGHLLPEKIINSFPL